MDTRNDNDCLYSERHTPSVILRALYSERYTQSVILRAFALSSMLLITFAFVAGLAAQPYNTFPTAQRVGIGAAKVVLSVFVPSPDDLLHIHGVFKNSGQPPANGTPSGPYNEAALRISLEDNDLSAFGHDLDHGTANILSDIYGQLCIQNEPTEPVNVKYSSFAKKFDYVLSTAPPLDAALMLPSPDMPYNFDMILTTKNPKASIRFGTTHLATIKPTTVSPDDIERMCISPYGAVGIGTSTPYYVDGLHINFTDDGAHDPPISPFPALKLSILNPEGNDPYYYSVNLALAPCDGCFDGLVKKYDGLLSITSGDMIFSNDKAPNDTRTVRSSNTDGGAFRFDTRPSQSGPQVEQFTILTNGQAGFKQPAPQENLQIGNVLALHGGDLSESNNVEKFISFNESLDASSVPLKMVPALGTAKLNFVTDESTSFVTANLTTYPDLLGFSNPTTLRLQTDKLSFLTTSGSTEDVQFYTSTGASAHSFFKNKVFIGIDGLTTTPSNLHESLMLGVNGAIFAKEVLVKVDGWSDFVFDDGYKLLPLTELGRQIKLTGHLPGIPTTAEVLKNGVELADMQARLLQKVEELTLYSIQLQKQNRELGKRILKLERKSK